MDTALASDASLGVGKWLAGGLAFFTTLFTLIGATGGALERILRNEPGEATFYFALMGVGIASGVVLAAIPNKKVHRGEVMLVAVGVVLIASAFVLPSISARGGVVLALVSVLLLAALVSWARRTLDFRFGSRNRGNAGWILGAAGLILLGIFLVPTWSAALALAGVLALAVAIAYVLRDHEPRLRGLVVAGGFVVFFVGMAGLFQLAVESTSAKDRPSVTAKFITVDGSVFIEATAKASGLRSDEHVLFEVEGLSLNEPLARHVAGLARAEPVDEREPGSDYAQTVYLSRTGPDENGEVDLSVLAPVSVGLYERMRVSAYLIQDDESDLSAREERARRGDDAERRRVDAYNTQREVFVIAGANGAPLAQNDANPIGMPSAQSYANRRYRQRVDHEEMLARLLYNADRARRDEDLQAQGAAQALEDIRCSPKLQDRGCIELLIPERPNRPDIVATWESGDPLLLNVSFSMASASADDAVTLGIVGRRSFETGFTHVLYEAALAPGSLGVIDHTIGVSPPAGTIEICVFGGAVNAASIPPAKQAYSSAEDCLSELNSVAAIRLKVPTAP
jgi:hypothetical protein